MEKALKIQKKALVVQLGKEIINLDSNTGKPTSIERHFVELSNPKVVPNSAYAMQSQMAQTGYAKASFEASLVPVKCVNIYV